MAVRLKKQEVEQFRTEAIRVLFSLLIPVS
jgi:hypothetical protein